MTIFGSILAILLCPVFASSLNLTTPPIAQINGSQVENLAIRSNGQILATTAEPFSHLWQIDPLRTQAPILVTTFQGTSGTYGITEGEPDVFYVATGNSTFNGTYITPPSAFAVWRVDMSCFDALSNSPAAAISKLVDMPPGVLLNGMTSISESPEESFLLAADSINGVVWSISVPNGTVQVAINDTSMQRPLGSNGLGINGIKYFNSSIYCKLLLLFDVPVCLFPVYRPLQLLS